MSQIAEITESVGIELEFTSISLGSSSRHLEFPSGWSITRDGSCTRRRPVLNGVGVNVSGMAAEVLPRHQVGGEFVSPVLNHDVTKIRKDVSQLFNILEDAGEHISSLTSTHVHVCMGMLPPTQVLKNLLHIAIRTEAPIFRLSTAELLQHRGIEHNDYMYCRPLTGVGPQYVIDDNGRWRQCFDVMRILENAKTSKDILRAWGRADHQPSKWIPPRYYWLNPVPLLRQGTIEFRIFNQTMDVENVIAWVSLCVAIVKTAYTINFTDLDWPLFPLGADQPDGESGTYRFKDMLQLVNPTFIGDKQLDQLQRLWLKSDWQPGVKEQVNHLAKDGRSIPIQAVAKSLVPETVSRSHIESIWNQGYYDNGR